MNKELSITIERGTEQIGGYLECENINRRERLVCAKDDEKICL